MECVFFEDIRDWDTWGKIFQSIPAFERLIMKIFEKEGLNFKEISHLTAGTNAVFKVDKYVVKIFAPVESGLNTEIDYNCEILGMKRAISLGINIPNVLAASYIEDKYIFRYIIMDYIEGKEAKDILKKYSHDNKVVFVRQLKENINNLNTICNEKFLISDVKERVPENTRWNMLPEKVVIQIHELIKRYHMSDKVYVHGDITGDNVMIAEDGTLYIIDFADGRIAPKEYELPPVLFDLFDFDETLIKEFIGEQNPYDFAEKCFYGILMHEFGSYFVKLICERIIGKEVSELTDILEIKKELYSLFIK